MNGYVGLLPYSDPAWQKAGYDKYNFVKALKTAGKIDHLVFSIYVGNDFKGSSIKFGSYDEVAFTGEMSLFKTRSTSSWDIKLYGIVFGGTTFTAPALTAEYVSVDPGWPYIALVQHDYDLVQAELLKLYPTIQCTGNTVCFFTQTCDTVAWKGLKFQLLLDDGFGDTRKPFDLKMEDMFDGTNDNGKQDKCVSKIASSQETDTRIFLGAPFYTANYVVYDMTPEDERKLGYIQIGIAPKNTVN